MVKEIDVTKYTAEEKAENELSITFDLEDLEDLNELEKELNTSIYFNPKEDITYKVELTTTKVQKVEKNFEGDKIIKYVIGVKTSNAKNEEFEGIWEVGRGVMKQLLKNFEVGAVFKITKTGTGLNTRYNVIKDF